MSGGKVAAVLFIALAVFGAVMIYQFYLTSVYPFEYAKSLMNRAQTAGQASDMIEYISKAKELIKNEHGTPQWWFPTPLTNWDLINKDLDGIKQRLEELTRLKETNPDAYQQGLDDVRGKIRTLEDQVSTTLWWKWNSLTNIILIGALFIVELALVLFAIGSW